MCRRHVVCIVRCQGPIPQPPAYTVSQSPNINVSAAAQSRQSCGPPTYTQTLPTHRQQHHYQSACIQQFEPLQQQFQQQNGMPSEMSDEHQR